MTVDLAALRAGVADGSVRSTPVPGGDICRAARLDLPDGRSVFAKTLPGAPPGFFAVEAAGLAWLADGTPPDSPLGVPEVLAVDDTTLVLPWLPPGRPTADSARAAGRGLAALHASGAPVHGRTDTTLPAATGRLPRDDTPTADWAQFWAERRLRPTLRQARDAGGIGAGDAVAVERVADRTPALVGPPEPPARLHGDLWSGNLHTDAAGRPWLVDPAAHGGSREVDLALLALFGAPGLDLLLAAYQQVAPLAPGWRDRVGLYQLYPLLVHAALFGGGYGAAAGSTARALL